MSQKTWVYCLTERTKQMRLNRGLALVCYECGEIIKIGDSVYSRNASSSKSKSKIYHKTCAERMNIL